MRDRLRPALRELSVRVAEARLSLVVAPAGSGKSTLLGCWRDALAEAGADCAWLALSPVHDDPALFLEDLFDALPGRSGDGPAGEIERDLPHVDREDAHAVARRVRNALRGRERPLHVFLDDLHCLSRDGPTDRLIDLLLRDERSMLRFAIASRGARPRAAARLVAAGVALEVGTEDLSLRSNQIAAVLREQGVEPDRLTATLLAETRGWATGVQLAAGALARLDENEHEAFVLAIARQPDLFEYVAGELLVHERAETLRLLEVAAVLGPADEAMLCEAAPERPPRGVVAHALDRGLLAREGERLGLHPLWTEYLLRQLRDRSTPEAWRALHARIAGALAGSDPERALRVGGEGEAWALVADLLERHGRSWVDRGRYHFVEEWLDRLEAAGVAASPIRAHLRALTAARRDPQGAIEALEATAASLRRAGDRTGEALALVDAGILAANEHRPEVTRRTMRQLFSLRRLVTDPDVRALSLAAVAILLVSRGRHRGAMRLLRRVRRGGLSLLPRATIELGLSIVGQYVDPEEAQALLDEVCADPEHRAHAPSFFMLQAQRARVRGLRGLDPESCLADARESVEAFQDFRLTMSEVGALDCQAKLLARLGRCEQSIQAFERAASLAEQLGHRDFEASMRGQCARELLSLGRSEAALAQARRAVEAFEAGRGPRDPFTFAFPAALAYRMLAECGHAQDAHRRVRAQEHRLRCPDLPIGHHQTLLFLARVAHLAGESGEAHGRLSEARDLRAHHGLRDHGSELDAELVAWAETTMDEPEATWDVRTLGGLEVWRRGRRVPDAAWRGRTTRRLLLRLLASETGERRERVEADLWPDADPRRAGNNLRVALSRLRKALGDGALLATGDRIALAPALVASWDVSRAASALRSGDAPDVALELLRGPFAPELFDDWAEELRREVEAQLLAVGCGCARSLLSEGDAHRAARLAERLAAFSPLCEEVWTLRARAELASGDPAAARRTLGRVRALFERELGIEPAAVLRDVEREIGAGPQTALG